MMRPKGPSSCAKGLADSCSKQNISKGNEKAKVLPEPVYAIPIKSRPINLYQNQFKLLTIKFFKSLVHGFKSS